MSVLGLCRCRAVPAVPSRLPSLCLLQLCEKEEEELTERSEQDSGINEEPLLTADQVPTGTRTPACPPKARLWPPPRMASAHRSPMAMW